MTGTLKSAYASPPCNTHTNTDTPATATTYQYGLVNSFASVLGMTFIAVHVETACQTSRSQLNFTARFKKPAPKLLTGSKSVLSFRRVTGQVGDAGTWHRP